MSCSCSAALQQAFVMDFGRKIYSDYCYSCITFVCKKKNVEGFHPLIILVVTVKKTDNISVVIYNAYLSINVHFFLLI